MDGEGVPYHRAVGPLYVLPSLGYPQPAQGEARNGRREGNTRSQRMQSRGSKFSNQERTWLNCVAGTYDARDFKAIGTAHIVSLGSYFYCRFVCSNTLCQIYVIVSVNM
jgi:hypothetical protein